MEKRAIKEMNIDSAIKCFNETYEHLNNTKWWRFKRIRILKIKKDKALINLCLWLSINYAD
tara:strand:- start:825 stop:1007 length:183 start_codon:yes stop_codon:yes gene_type:complete